MAAVARRISRPRRRRSELAELPAELARDEVELTEEWLDDAELATRFSADSTLAAALPGRHGRAKRLDIDPRIVVFEGTPPPTNSCGPTRHVGHERWVMDTRAHPAALVLPNAQHRLVIWGEAGLVWLYELTEPA